MRPPVVGPTKRQKEVLDFIKSFISKNAFSPTVREIAEHFGVQVNGTAGHLKALEKKRLITRQVNKARTIRVL
jgi:repressor LexA